MSTATPSRFLTIDIGGSGLKAAVADRSGVLLTERVRVDTPHPCPPDVLLERLVTLVTPLKPFDRIAVGFPGVVHAGAIVTAPNLGTELLAGFDLGGALQQRLGRPVRVANDATVQGLAAITGRGVEIVITLGTGFGAALFMDGRALPTLELGHHPFHKGKTYEDCLGDRARRNSGGKQWNRRLARAIRTIRALTHFDALYIGGGNAQHIRIAIDADTKIVANEDGVKGGVALWRADASRGRAGSR